MRRIDEEGAAREDGDERCGEHAVQAVAVAAAKDMTRETPAWDPPFHENFGRLVLGCIDASDSESRRTFQQSQIHHHQTAEFLKISEKSP